MDNFLDLTYGDFEKKLRSSSEPKYRIDQIWEGIYKHHYVNWQSFSNLPISLRKKLSLEFSILPFSHKDSQSSTDKKTTKLLFKLFDGIQIESVILRNADRNTICISTQAGCPVGCLFCATGHIGFKRNLTAAEIIGQIQFTANYLEKDGQRINNIVLMGMGEPFLNYEAVLKSVKRFNDPQGYGIGARKITISTIGIVDKVKKFADENRQFKLAISLHAPNDKIRKMLVPAAKRNPIEDVINAVDYYITKTNRRITYEYVLINDINNSHDCARELASLLKHQNCHINLIALNPNKHFPGKAPDENSVRQFSNVLLSHGIPTTIRNSQGAKIKAGCGQLAGSR